MNPIQLIKVYLDKKAMDYNMSKDKYKEYKMVLKNFESMSDAELVIHMQFIYGFLYPASLIREFLTEYENPVLAFIFYRRGYLYLRDKTEVKKVFKFSLMSKLSNTFTLSLSVLVLLVSFYLIITNEYVSVLYNNNLILGILGFIASFYLFVSVLENDLRIDAANEFKSLKKKKIDQKV